MSSRRFDRGNSSDHRSPSSLPDHSEPVPPVGLEPDILLSQTPPVPPLTRQPHFPSHTVNPESFVPQTPTRPDQENWASMAASVQQPGAPPSAFQTQSGILAGNVGPYFETSSQNLQLSPGLISGSFGHHEMSSSARSFGQGTPDNAGYSGVMRGYESGTPAPVPNSEYPYGVGSQTSRQPNESGTPSQPIRLQEQQTYSTQHHSLPPPHPQIHIPPTSFTQQPSPGLQPPSGQAGYLPQGYELRPELRSYQMPATTMQPAQHPAYLSPFPEPYVPQQMSSQYHLPPGYATTQEQSHALSPMQPLAGSVPSRHSPSPVPMDQVRVVNSRPKPQCWEHGCNGREFSTFSNLLRHQREKAGLSAKPECPYCGTVFTRTTARNGHLSQGKCKARRQPTPK